MNSSRESHKSCVHPSTHSEVITDAHRIKALIFPFRRRKKVKGNRILLCHNQLTIHATEEITLHYIFLASIVPCRTLFLLVTRVVTEGGDGGFLTSGVVCEATYVRKT